MKLKNSVRIKQTITPATIQLLEMVQLNTVELGRYLTEQAMENPAIDIDELAVKTARENGVINGFTEPKFTVFQGNLTDKVKGKYDIVVANIVADIIVMFTKDVGKFLKEDGLYITSGIIDTREPDVLAAFEEYGFEVVGRHESSGWLCFETRLKK